MSEIYCKEIGSGRPVVLLHGYGADHRLMTGCMEPVFRKRREKSGWRRLYLDLPGMGKSPAPEHYRNSDHMVEGVLSFLEETLSREPFVLAGESYGGYLARELVRRIPRRIEGLLLLCPAVYPHKEMRDLPPKRVIKKEAPVLPPDVGPREAGDFDEFTVQTPETWRRYEEDVLSGARLADRTFLKLLRPHGYALGQDPDALSAPFLHPVLVLLGRQDHVVGYRDAWKLLENYPRATFAVLDRAGHNLQIEQPFLFEALTHEWLDRVVEGP